MKYLIILLVILIGGCGFARRDVVVETKFIYPDTGIIKVVTETTSVTVWTLFKEIHWGQYYSENDDFELWAPWGIVKSGEK